MPKRRRGDRAIGPYAHRGGFRVVEITRAGQRTTSHFAERDDAVAYRDEFNNVAAIAGKTVAQAIEEYRQEYLVNRGNKPASWTETKRRILALLGSDALELDVISPKHAADLYAAYAASGVSVDSHRGALSHVKTFMGWCSVKGWIDANPFADVHGIGRKKKGKDQLRRDEAREWLRVAYALAMAGDERALMAMLTLLLGVRASEVLNRQVRDVDDQGLVLVIPSSKTEAGRRILQIPVPLQHLLRAQAAGRHGEEPLFGEHNRRFVNAQVGRICKLAGVRRVTAQGMRGLHASLAVEEGTTGHVVTRAMGHESFQVTAAHYATAQAVTSAHHRRVGGVFQLPAPPSEGEVFPTPPDEGGKK